MVEKSEERDHFEDPGVDRIISNWIFKKKDGVYVDRINLAQDRDKRRALVNTIMNLRVPQNAGNFLASCGTASFSRRILNHVASDPRILIGNYLYNFNTAVLGRQYAGSVSPFIPFGTVSAPQTNSRILASARTHHPNITHPFIIIIIISSSSSSSSISLRYVSVIRFDHLQVEDAST